MNFSEKLGLKLRKTWLTASFSPNQFHLLARKSRSVRLDQKSGFARSSVTQPRCNIWSSRTEMEWYVSLIAKRNCFHDLSQGENSSIALDFTITWSFFIYPVLQWLPHYMIQCRRNIVLHPISLVIGTEAKIYVFYPPDKLSSRFFFWNSAWVHRIAGLCDWTKSCAAVEWHLIVRNPTFGQVAQTGNPMHSRAVPKKNREDNLSGG